MTDLAQVALEAAAKLNPANSSSELPAERKLIPMTMPQMSLVVPPLPGYHLHWMRGTPERIQQARAAGYEFVTRGEIEWVHNDDLAGDLTESSRGGSDLGSRVSVLASTGAGNYLEGGQPLRLYLMKQKWEHYVEAQSHLEKRNDQIADALTASFKGGQGAGAGAGMQPGETPQDYALRRVDPKRTAVPNLFTRKPNRSAHG